MPLSQLELDTRLGELAAEMETRMHGGVSVEAVRTTNHRDPLNHRSLLERLVRASPSDGMLLIDANADAELLHITANNGLCRGVPHSQVPSEMEEELQSQLRRGLDHGELVPVSSIVPGQLRAVMSGLGWRRSLAACCRDLPAGRRVAGAGGGFCDRRRKEGYAVLGSALAERAHPASRWPAPPLWDTDGPLHVPIGRWLLSRCSPGAFDRRGGVLVGGLFPLRSLVLVSSRPATRKESPPGQRRRAPWSSNGRGRSRSRWKHRGIRWRSNPAAGGWRHPTNRL